MSVTFSSIIHQYWVSSTSSLSGNQILVISKSLHIKIGSVPQLAYLVISKSLHINIGSVPHLAYLGISKSLHINIGSVPHLAYLVISKSLYRLSVGLILEK